MSSELSAERPPPFRRIVTGHTSAGLGTVQTDSLIPGEDASKAGLPGLRSGTVWTTECIPSKDANSDVDGAERPPSQKGLGLVMSNGTNLRFTDLAPKAVAPMHRTSSIDYNILVFGKLILMTDDGSEKLVENPGDTIVQKGNMHAWRNPGPGWTRWVSVLIDAEPALVNGQPLFEGWDTKATLK